MRSPIDLSRDPLIAIIERAVEVYGCDGHPSKGGLFTAASFSNAFCQIADRASVVDGTIVSWMMWDRPYVTQDLRDNGYFTYLGREHTGGSC